MENLIHHHTPLFTGLNWTGLDILGFHFIYIPKLANTQKTDQTYENSLKLKKVKTHFSSFPLN